MDARGPWPKAPRVLRAAPHAVLLAGCVGLVASLVWSPGAGWAAVGVLGGAALSAVALRRARARSALGALAATVFLAGLGWGGAQLDRTAPPAIPIVGAVRGTVALDAPPIPQGEGWRARGVASELVGANGRRVPRGTRLLLQFDGDAAPRAGRVFRVAGRLGDAAGAEAPGWWRRYLQRQGIAARLTVTDAIDEGWRGGIAGLRERWRGWVRRSVARGLGGDRGALVRGMALGGGSELSEGAAEAFRTSGLWHLLAVSGQNVTVVALAMLMALRTIGVSRRRAIVGAALALAAYCLAADGGASVGRACAVGALGLVAELRSTTRERWYLLLVGLLALLAAQPRSIHDPGLQLSFAAVAGITALGPLIERGLDGWLPPPVARLAAAAGAAGLATAPVLAWHFERVSVAGLAANVVAVPLAAPVVVTALLGAVAGPLVPPVGAAFTGLAALGADLMLVVARIAAAPPGASVAVPREAAPMLMAVGALWLALRRLAGGRWAPGAVVGRYPVRSASLGLVLVAVAVIATRPPEPAAWPLVPEIVVLDVGQGQAVLIRDGSGRAAMIDAGPPGSPAPVVAQLRRLGVRRLDAVAISHPALDHVGGLEDLVEAVEVRRLLLPPFPAGPPHAATARALGAARRDDVLTTRVRAGDSVTVGAWRLLVVWPARGVAEGVDPNRGSLVVRAEAAGWSALLPGDAESPTLAPLGVGAVDLLVVGHHGSADDGLGPLLRALRPRAAIVSVGVRNRFGHPSASILGALDDGGVATYRTDRDGRVSVSRTAAGIAVAASR